MANAEMKPSDGQQGECPPIDTDLWCQFVLIEDKRVAFDKHEVLYPSEIYQTLTGYDPPQPDETLHVCLDSDSHDGAFWQTQCLLYDVPVSMFGCPRRSLYEHMTTAAGGVYRQPLPSHLLSLYAVTAYELWHIIPQLSLDVLSTCRESERMIRHAISARDIEDDEDERPVDSDWSDTDSGICSSNDDDEDTTEVCNLSRLRGIYKWRIVDTSTADQSQLDQRAEKMAAQLRAGWDELRHFGEFLWLYPLIEASNARLYGRGIGSLGNNYYSTTHLDPSTRSLELDCVMSNSGETWPGTANLTFSTDLRVFAGRVRFSTTSKDFRTMAVEGYKVHDAEQLAADQLSASASYKRALRQAQNIISAQCQHQARVAVLGLEAVANKWPSIKTTLHHYLRKEHVQQLDHLHELDIDRAQLVNGKLGWPAYSSSPLVIGERQHFALLTDVKR